MSFDFVKRNLLNLIGYKYDPAKYNKYFASSLQSAEIAPARFFKKVCKLVFSCSKYKIFTFFKWSEIHKLNLLNSHKSILKQCQNLFFLPKIWESASFYILFEGAKETHGELFYSWNKARSCWPHKTIGNRGCVSCGCWRGTDQDWVWRLQGSWLLVLFLRPRSLSGWMVLQVWTSSSSTR